MKLHLNTLEYKIVKDDTSEDNKNEIDDSKIQDRLM